MIRCHALRRSRPAILAAFLLLTMPGLVRADSALAVPERKFTTSPILANEVETLVTALEAAHYNRLNVHNDDYAEVIPDYMTQLDPDHLYFLASDEANFSKEYGDDVFYNVADLGNIDPAYEIFYTYEQRLADRTAWILGQLQQNFDFTSNQTYRPDRSKVPWPASEADADNLWRRRLKFEMLQEILNKKTPVEARDVLRKRYERMLKDVGEIDGSDLAERYLTTIAGLYDPHSEYWSAETYEDFKIQMQLHLIGIGAVLGKDDDYCKVEELVPGGPANLGRQLKPGDRILSVAQDGQEPVDVVGMNLRKIVDLIRGAKGTRVRLVVQPADATDPSVRKEIVITRDVVKLSSTRAYAAIFQVPGPGGKTIPLGVITLPAFYGPGDSPDDGGDFSASRDVATLLGELKQAGIQGLVLDLRHNGGGFLSEAIDLTGLFVGRGPVVQERDGRGDIQVDDDDDDRIAYTGPLAVLVDRFSASASEIVAGALQSYGRAVVVGDSSTHGKGTVQRILELQSLSPELANSSAKIGAAKITVQKFYLPNGASTQLRGVVPDIVLPSIDDYLPIGESDLPHALVWDRIPAAPFDGAPLDPKIVEALRKDSLERQAKLPEFSYLDKDVDWFKSREEQKLISLNLEERLQEKASDDAFIKKLDAEKALLAKQDYPYKEFRLAPPIPTSLKAPPDKKADADDLDELNTDQDDTYAKADVHLRETLRVLVDAIDLGRDHQFWVSNHPPLTVAQSKG